MCTLGGGKDKHVGILDFASQPKPEEHISDFRGVNRVFQIVLSLCENKGSLEALFGVLPGISGNLNLPERNTGTLKVFFFIFIYKH